MIKTRRFITGFILAIGLMTGCKDARTDQMLSHIDTLMNQYPDSALQLLDSLKADKPQWAKSQRMHYDLLRLKAENKAFILLTSDYRRKDVLKKVPEKIDNCLMADIRLYFQGSAILQWGGTPHVNS